MGVTAIPASAVPLRGAEVPSGHDASSPVLLVTLRKVNCLLTPRVVSLAGRAGRGWQWTRLPRCQHHKYAEDGQQVL